MKARNLLKFLMVGLPISLAAQPVLDSAHVAVPHATFPISAGALVSPGASGAGVTWDFSGLTLSPVGTLEILDPATSPYISIYPTANYVWKITTGGTDKYQYQILSGTKLEVIGDGNPSAGWDNYSPNPKISLVFPFTYPSTLVDRWERTDMVSDTVIRSYDGYGTLILPSGTFQNVVRITTSGSADNVGFWNSDPIYPLMVIDNENGMTLAFGPGTLGQDPEQSEGIIFPNPTENQMVLRDEFFFEGVLLGLDGREIARFTNPLLDLTSFPAGIYFLRVNRVDGSQYQKKIVKK